MGEKLELEIIGIGKLEFHKLGVGFLPHWRSWSKFQLVVSNGSEKIHNFQGFEKHFQ